jgi:hypothetical protein
MSSQLSLAALDAMDRADAAEDARADAEWSLSAEEKETAADDEDALELWRDRWREP